MAQRTMIPGHMDNNRKFKLSPREADMKPDAILNVRFKTAAEEGRARGLFASSICRDTKGLSQKLAEIHMTPFGCFPGFSGALVFESA